MNNETEYEPCAGAQDALNKMARAHKRGTGCRLTADEIISLSLTSIGQLWEQDDPRKAPIQYASCDYQGSHFGASYPDASCDGGYLIDDDRGGYDPSVTRIPCPQCNAEEHRAYYADE